MHECAKHLSINDAAFSRIKLVIRFEKCSRTDLECFIHDVLDNIKNNVSDGHNPAFTNYVFDVLWFVPTPL